LFDKFLTDYENQLLLFEELAFQQFTEFEDGGLTELQDLGLGSEEDAKSTSVVEINEIGFTLLDEYVFAELKI